MALTFRYRAARKYLMQHADPPVINPTAEDAHWRSSYNTASYYKPGYDYDTDYRNAYSYGYAAREHYTGRQWDDRLETELSRDWAKVKGQSRLTWEQAKYAVKDAWNRVTH